MRHTLVLRGAPTLRSAELSYNLPNVQDGQCVRLAQGQHQIYVTYRQAEGALTRQAEVNCHLLTLNGLESGMTVTVEQVALSGLEHLVVEVSELDWKIVSLNQLKIAESFLEQVSVVWPNAQLPIYYEGSNFVVLKALCSRAGRLNVNTTVEFIDKTEKQKPREEQLGQEPLTVQFTLAKEDKSIQHGYINSIMIDRQMMEQLHLDSSFCIIDNRLEFVGLPTISEFLESEKKRQKSKDEEQSSSKKLVRIEAQDNLREGEYSCSKQAQQLLGLSERITISSTEQGKLKIETLSLDLFLNDENLTIRVYRLQETLQRAAFSVQEKAELEEFLGNHILETLFAKKEFYVLQEAYPYSLNASLYTFTLTHRTDAKVTSKLHRLALIGKETAARREECLRKLKKKIVFGCASGDQPLHEHYGMIARWIKVIQGSKSEAVGRADRENLAAAEQVFRAIYHEEITKVTQFLTISKFAERVCAVCSFGSNGKSFLHEHLSRHGHRMWRINFRQLNAPSLSFKEIDFYLEWVFANSPYRALFLDDFDSLCGKVEDGDHLRKRERTIAKLLLRKINAYLDIYRIKLIITTKSDSALDEQLAKHIVVTLKNPSRELRLTALKRLTEACVVESPIKKCMMEEEGEGKHETQLMEIVEATESLTYGAFVKHAISFTKPKDAKIANIYDFSQIAGLQAVKATIKTIIERPIKYSFLFKSVPIKLPRGILLFGATGNGKSAVATAVQDEFKMKYFSVKGSDILSKYIGGSEAAVRDIFEKALSVSPSIIFFDEFESIVPKRSSNNTGVNDRIVNQFLCYLDGVSAISGVYIIAASSRPDMIDPAVLRPGRLDAHLFLDYPDSEEREQLIRMYEKSIRLEVGIEEVVAKTAGFSYSDMVGLFKELRIKRSAEVLNMHHYTSQDFINIGRPLLESTLASFKLSVDPREQKRQRQLYLNFKNGVGPDIKAQRQVQF